MPVNILMNQVPMCINQITDKQFLELEQLESEFLLESVSLEELETTYQYGHELINEPFFEAITSRKNGIYRTILAVARSLDQQLAGTGIEISKGEEVEGERVKREVEIGKTRISGGFATITARIPLSDGQSVAIIFHSPSGDPAKIASDDLLVAFRFLLNKADVTSVVSPRGGYDVSLKQLCVSLSNLIERNSAKFIQKVEGNKAKKDRLATLETELENIEQESSQISAELPRIESQTSSNQKELERYKKMTSKAQKRIDSLKEKLASFQNGKASEEAQSQTIDDTKTILPSGLTDFDPSSLDSLEQDDLKRLQSAKEAILHNIKNSDDDEAKSSILRRLKAFSFDPELYDALLDWCLTLKDSKNESFIALNSNSLWRYASIKPIASESKEAEQANQKQEIINSAVERVTKNLDDFEKYSKLEPSKRVSHMSNETLADLIKSQIEIVAKQFGEKEADKVLSIIRDKQASFTNGILFKDNHSIWSFGTGNIQPISAPKPKIEDKPTQEKATNEEGQLYYYLAEGSVPTGVVETVTPDDLSAHPQVQILLEKHNVSEFSKVVVFTEPLTDSIKATHGLYELTEAGGTFAAASNQAREENLIQAMADFQNYQINEIGQYFGMNWSDVAKIDPMYLVNYFDMAQRSVADIRDLPYETKLKLHNQLELLKVEKVTLPQFLNHYGEAANYWYGFNNGSLNNSRINDLDEYGIEKTAMLEAKEAKVYFPNIDEYHLTGGAFATAEPLTAEQVERLNVTDLSNTYQSKIVVTTDQKALFDERVYEGLKAQYGNQLSQSTIDNIAMAYSSELSKIYQQFPEVINRKNDIELAKRFTQIKKSYSRADFTEQLNRLKADTEAAKQKKELGATDDELNAVIAQFNALNALSADYNSDKTKLVLSLGKNSSDTESFEIDNKSERLAAMQKMQDAIELAKQVDFAIEAGEFSILDLKKAIDEYNAVAIDAQAKFDGDKVEVSKDKGQSQTYFSVKDKESIADGIKRLNKDATHFKKVAIQSKAMKLNGFVNGGTKRFGRGWEVSHDDIEHVRKLAKASTVSPTSYLDENDHVSIIIETPLSDADEDGKFTFDLEVETIDGQNNVLLRPRFEPAIKVRTWEEMLEKAKQYFNDVMIPDALELAKNPVFYQKLPVDTQRYLSKFSSTSVNNASAGGLASSTDTETSSSGDTDNKSLYATDEQVKNLVNSVKDMRFFTVDDNQDSYSVDYNYQPHYLKKSAINENEEKSRDRAYQELKAWRDTELKFKTESDVNVENSIQSFKKLIKELNQISAQYNATIVDDDLIIKLNDKVKDEYVLTNSKSRNAGYMALRKIINKIEAEAKTKAQEILKNFINTRHRLPLGMKLVKDSLDEEGFWEIRTPMSGLLNDTEAEFSFKITAENSNVYLIDLISFKKEKINNIDQLKSKLQMIYKTEFPKEFAEALKGDSFVDFEDLSEDIQTMIEPFYNRQDDDAATNGLQVNPWEVTVEEFIPLHVKSSGFIDPSEYNATSDEQSHLVEAAMNDWVDGVKKQAHVEPIKESVLDSFYNLVGRRQFYETFSGSRRTGIQDYTPKKKREESSNNEPVIKFDGLDELEQLVKETNSLTKWGGYSVDLDLNQQEISLIKNGKEVNFYKLNQNLIKLVTGEVDRYLKANQIEKLRLRRRLLDYYFSGDAKIGVGYNIDKSRLITDGVVKISTPYSEYSDNPHFEFTATAQEVLDKTEFTLELSDDVTEKKSKVSKFTMLKEKILETTRFEFFHKFKDLLDAGVVDQSALTGEVKRIFSYGSKANNVETNKATELANKLEDAAKNGTDYQALIDLGVAALDEFEQMGVLQQYEPIIESVMNKANELMMSVN